MSVRRARMVWGALLLSALGIAVCLALIMIAPGALPGNASDLLATANYIRAIAASGEGLAPQASFPFGTTYTLDQWSLFSYVPAVIVARLSNEVTAIRAIQAASLVVSGILMLILVFQLTRNAVAAVISCIAFMLLPYRQAMVQYHFTLMRIEFIPLVLLSIVWHHRTRKWYSAIGIGGAQFYAFSVDPHYGLFSLVIVGIYCSYLVIGPKHSGARNALMERFCEPVGIGLLSVAAGIPQWMRVLRLDKQLVGVHRAYEQLITYSARPWDYIVPSVQHPLLGRITRDIVLKNIHGSYWHEQTLYVGLAIAALALLGVRRVRRMEGQEQRMMGYLLVAVILGAGICSMPPEVSILGCRISLPGHLLYRVFPMFRVYARWGVLVGAAAVVLTGYAVAGMQGKLVGRMLVVVLGGLIVFEYFPPVQPVRFDTAAVPVFCHWLAERDSVRAVCFYPLGWPPQKKGEELTSWMMYEDLFWQREHEVPMFNGEPASRLDWALKLELADPGHANTPARLAWLGVSHLAVHLDDITRATLMEVRSHRDLQKVYGDAETEIFRITGATIRILPSEFMVPSSVPATTERTICGDIELGIVCAAAQRLAAYGPHMALYEGRYELEVELLSDSPQDGVLLITADSGATTVSEFSLVVDRNRPTSYIFETEGAVGFEFRVYLPSGDYRFGGMRLTRLGSAEAA